MVVARGGMLQMSFETPWIGVTDIAQKVVAAGVELQPSDGENKTAGCAHGYDPRAIRRVGVERKEASGDVVPSASVPKSIATSLV